MIALMFLAGAEWHVEMLNGPRECQTKPGYHAYVTDTWCALDGDFG